MEKTNKVSAAIWSHGAPAEFDGQQGEAYEVTAAKTWGIRITESPSKDGPRYYIGDTTQRNPYGTGAIEIHRGNAVPGPGHVGRQILAINGERPQSSEQIVSIVAHAVELARLADAGTAAKLTIMLSLAAATEA